MPSNCTITEPLRQEREHYIRENAVAIVEELEERIDRYKKEITSHLKSKKSLRQEVAKLRKQIEESQG